MDVWQNFLRELTENGIPLVKWIPSPTDDADLHTNNFVAVYSKKHVAVYTGKGEYSGMN